MDKLQGGFGAFKAAGLADEPGDIEWNLKLGCETSG